MVTFLNVAHFPIAVERVLQPRLRHRPVVLVEPSSKASCLVVSREALDCGVQRGMSLIQARKRCRDLVAIYPDHAHYKRAAAAIQRLTNQFTPTTEPSRLGQFYLDIARTNYPYGNAHDTTMTLCRMIRKELKLPAIAGIASNKLVSRIACSKEDTDDVAEVEQGLEALFLAPRTINVLPAVTRDIRPAMQDLNIHLIEHLQALHIDVLYEVFGRTAIHLSRQAQGIDPSPVTSPEAPPKIEVIGEMVDEKMTGKLLKPSVDYEQVRQTARELTFEGVIDLRRKRRAAHEGVVTVFYTDGLVEKKSKRYRAATDSLPIWLNTVEDLLKEAFTRRIGARRIAVTFSQLSVPTRTLFLDDTHEQDNLLDALTCIRNRFGNDAILLGRGKECSHT